ncbi:MAG: hypothetical protein V1824_02770 [archaeon]
MAKIAIDIDDTLVLTVPFFINYLKSKNIDIYFEGYHTLHHLNKDQIIELMDFHYSDFINNSKFDELMPIDSSKEVLNRLKTKHDLILITSRHPCLESQTKDWIKHHFENTFSHIEFGRYNEEQRHKGPVHKHIICKELNVDLLIDDVYSTAYNCAKENIPVILFNYNNNYEWSKGPISKNIFPAKNWIEVEEKIKLILKE